MLTRARPPTGEGTNGWVTRQSSPREAPKATGLGRCVFSSTVHSSHSMLALCRCMFDRSLQFVNNRGVGWSPAGTFRSRGGSLTRARPQAGAPSVPGGLLTRARPRAGAPSVTAWCFIILLCEVRETIFFFELVSNCALRVSWSSQSQSSLSQKFLNALALSTIKRPHSRPCQHKQRPATL